MTDQTFEHHSETVQVIRAKIDDILCKNKLGDAISATAWIFLDVISFAYAHGESDESRNAVKVYFNKLHVAFDEIIDKMDKERMGSGL